MTVVVDFLIGDDSTEALVGDEDAAGVFLEAFEDVTGAAATVASGDGASERSSSSSTSIADVAGADAVAFFDDDSAPLVAFALLFTAPAPASTDDDWLHPLTLAPVSDFLLTCEDEIEEPADAAEVRAGGG